MRVAGVGINRRDHPIRGDLLRDLPVPVGAIRALEGLDILAGDQRQQRHRLSRPRRKLVIGQMPEQPVGVADQAIDQQIAGRLVIPAIAGLPGSS